MSSRLAEPTAMRTRPAPCSHHDDISKRPPPSPSNKVPPPKKLDARSRPADEKSSVSPKPLATPPSSEPVADKPIINMSAFSQILELDEDDHSFLSSMVQEYFTQAKATFTKMDESFAKKDLKELSSLGHFLKGSSASIGVAQVEHTCEEIQHLGNQTDPTSKEAKLSAEDALAKIKPLLSRVKNEYNAAANWLETYRNA